MIELRRLERVSSGVPGLDEVLGGGFPKSGIFIVQGLPGTGKTILGNQVSHRHASAGGRALYVTLLSENHTRMLLNLSTLRFFDPARMPEQVAYISGLGPLDTEGLPGLVSLLRREIAERKSTVLVLDGLVVAEDYAMSRNDFKRFVEELHAHAALYSCTVFLLTTGSGEVIAPEHTMVDGIIELTEVRYGSRTERGLFVTKLRGSDLLPGRHSFRITDAGLVVYPRLEVAFRASTQPDKIFSGRLSTGVRGLDEMLGGGLPEASVTGVVGPSGIGKTTLGLHFACASRAAEPGLFFGFYEAPSRLKQQAACVGIDLEGAVGRGDVEIIWQPLGEDIQDALAHQLLEAISRRGVKRLTLDGLGGFMEASVEPERIGRFISALSHGLRGRGVTSLITMESRDLIGSGLQLPVGGISSLAEGLIAMRFVEHRALARRLLSVVKIRGSGPDAALREFVISGKGGISLTGTFEDAEHLLSGFAQDRRPADAPFSASGEE